MKINWFSKIGLLRHASGFCPDCVEEEPDCEGGTVENLFEGSYKVLSEDEFIMYGDEFGQSSAAKHKGKNVTLNKPRYLKKGEPGFGRKQYVVYVGTGGGKVKRITFGDPNLDAKPKDAKARKSFRARHKCHTKKDKTKPGYWACRYPPNW